MDAAMLAYELSRETDRVISDPEGREMVTSAAMLATHLHRNQTRRVRRDLPRVPYIEHPLRNALRLIRWGRATEDAARIVMALLHDVVEDCAQEILTDFAIPAGIGEDVDVDAPADVQNAAIDWLKVAYGDRVGRAVALVTNKPFITREEYQAHIECLAYLAMNSYDRVPCDALIVKASDLMDNAGSLRHQLAAGEHPQTVQRLAEKYLPALRPVIDACCSISDMTVADHLIDVEASLRKILG
jgi:(p)ppGpp synthase/HD superfamily hydrolase